jgi:hypothetical protein
MGSRAAQRLWIPALRHEAQYDHWARGLPGAAVHRRAKVRGQSHPEVRLTEGDNKPPAPARVALAMGLADDSRPTILRACRRRAATDPTIDLICGRRGWTHPLGPQPRRCGVPVVSDAAAATCPSSSASRADGHPPQEDAIRSALHGNEPRSPGCPTPMGRALPRRSLPTDRGANGDESPRR